MRTNEAADRIFVDGKISKFDEGETFPFIIDEHNYILRGKRRGTHGDIIIEEEEELGDIDLDGELDVETPGVYHGRIFATQKVLAFWKQPSKEELPIFLKLIKNEFRVIDIDWAEWRIEVYNGDNSRGWSYNEPEDYEYIFVRDYVGSQDVPDEAYQKHMFSPMKKEKPIDRFAGWTPKKFKYQLPDETEAKARARVTKYKYQENFTTIFSLFESPFIISNLDLHFSDRDALPFLMIDDNIYIGEYGEWHGSILNDYTKNTTSTKNVDGDYDEDDIYNFVYDENLGTIYHGRFWKGSKIITFWDYPPVDIFENYIKKLEKRVNLKIWNNGWKIEIKKDLSNVIDLSLSGNNRYWNAKVNVDIIPIEDYIGSDNNDYIEHIKSPMNKKKVDTEGWKPKKYKYQLPNESEVEARARVTKYKYQESLITTFDLFEATDHIYFDDKDTIYNEGDTYPFIINNNTGEIFKGEQNRTHREIIRKYDSDEWSEHKLEDDSYGIFHGRIFGTQKVLTFWKQPSEEQLHKFMPLIKKEFSNELNINWAYWFVELYTGDEKLGFSYNKPDDYKYIPINSYSANDYKVDVPDEIYQQHLLSPIDKKKSNPEGWTPKKYKYQLPDETEVEARARVNKYKYQESLVTKFFEFNVQGEIGFGDAAEFANDSDEMFWGNMGAGVLAFSKKTKRFLVLLRSQYVNEPGTYGLVGGKLDEESGETDTQEVAKREFVEETGFSGNIKLIPVFIYNAPGFEYHNFIGIVDDEFEPTLDWENDNSRWLNYNELIKLYPKHFGLKELLNDKRTINIIESLIYH